MKSQLGVEIDAPIESVFPLTTENVSAWSLTCVEDEVLDEKPGHVGTTFRVVTEERGRRMEFQGTVTEYEAPVRNRVHLVGPAFDIDVVYRFEDLGDGRTRVTQESEVRGKGVFRVLLFLMGFLMKKSACDAQQKELDSLRRYCEERVAASA